MKKKILSLLLAALSVGLQLPLALALALALALLLDNIRRVVRLSVESLRSVGNAVYGIFPVRLRPDEGDSSNGHDGENDDVDGIVEVQGSRFKVQAGAPWYDLSGRKVSLSPDPSPVGEGRKLPKGIYIHNGRKVIIK